ncbi:hypothetical protein [Xenorhabdus japonica]|uniref:Uncharacterized protein n=1 Tax=Xenorhabdus japonica TaxID=53341 RepID=A0A1I4YCL6_9GAMM|nr:hypothetical protein [Xenorhabdus japonica]SFN35787.1 hypothetical protein SAMN05421579_101170 [Xenorhabdus japonica]
MMSVYLSTFDAYFVAGATTSTNRLYANGNQQVKVAINIRKQVDGVDTPLTSAEKDSVTITARSSNPSASIYSGWSCDKSKNQYDEGVRGENSRSMNGVAVLMDTEDQDGQVKAGVETVYRYLRTSANPNETMEFMAVITINGEKFTTNMDPHVQTLTVTPRTPYKIRSYELVLKREDAYTDEYSKGNYVDVDVYYWTLPSSLAIKNQQINGNANVSGGALASITGAKVSPIRTGIVLHTSTQNFTVNNSMATSNLPGGSNKVRLISGDSFIRASRGACDNYYYDSTSKYNSGCVVTIIDNFGCVSKFSVRASDDLNILDIYDA